MPRSANPIAESPSPVKSAFFKRLSKHESPTLKRLLTAVLYKCSQGERREVGLLSEEWQAEVNERLAIHNRQPFTQRQFSLGQSNLENLNQIIVENGRIRLTPQMVLNISQCATSETGNGEATDAENAVEASLDMSHPESSFSTSTPKRLPATVNTRKRRMTTTTVEVDIASPSNGTPSKKARSAPLKGTIDAGDNREDEEKFESQELATFEKQRTAELGEETVPAILSLDAGANLPSGDTTEVEEDHFEEIRESQSPRLLDLEEGEIPSLSQQTHSNSIKNGGGVTSQVAGGEEMDSLINAYVNLDAGSGSSHGHGGGERELLGVGDLILSEANGIGGAGGVVHEESKDQSVENTTSTPQVSSSSGDQKQVLDWETNGLQAVETLRLTSQGLHNLQNHSLQVIENFYNYDKARTEAHQQELSQLRQEKLLAVETAAEMKKSLYIEKQNNERLKGVWEKSLKNVREEFELVGMRQKDLIIDNSAKDEKIAQLERTIEELKQREIAYREAWRPFNQLFSYDG